VQPVAKPSISMEKRGFHPKLPPRTLRFCRSQSLTHGCRSISLARLRLALPRTLLTSFFTPFFFVQVVDHFNPSLGQLLLSAIIIFATKHLADAARKFLRSELEPAAFHASCTTATSRPIIGHKRTRLLWACDFAF
jgi:hypothetical protein